MFNWVGLPNSIKHNLLDCIQLCSIERYWFGNRTHSKFDVWFCWIAKLNQTQSTGWIWLRLISPCLIDYTRMCISSTLGNSRKYPYPTTASFIVLTPALPLEILECVTSPSPQNSIIVNPLPFGISAFFGSTFLTWQRLYEQRTWIYASSMLWSDGARWQALLFSNKKHLPRVTGLCKLLFKSEFGYKYKHHSW